MLNLSDKELDRLSREAAQEHDPGDVLGPRSWDKLEPRLDTDLGKTGTSPMRGVRRFPFYYAPAAILLVAGVVFFTLQNHRSGQNKPSGSPPTAASSATQSIPLPKNSEHSSNSTPSASSSATADSTAVGGPLNATATTGSTASAAKAPGSNAPASDNPGSNATASNEPNTPGHNATTATGSTAGASTASTAAPTGANGASTARGASPSGARTTTGTSPSGKLTTGNAPSGTTPRTRATTDGSLSGTTAAISNRTRNHKPGRSKNGKNIVSTDGNDNSSNGNLAAAATTARDGNTNPTTSDGNTTSSASNPAKPKTTAPRELTHANLPRPNRLQQRAAISDSALRAYTDKTSTILIGKNKSLRINRTLQFGLSLAPDFSSVNSLAGDKPGSTIGLTLDYQFANHWYLSTGLLLDRKNYAARAQDYHVPYNYYWQNGIHNVDFVKGSFNMLEIPLNLRYDFSVAGNTLFFASAGFSSYLMTNENCNYYFNAYGPRTDLKSFNYSNNNNYLFSTINLSLGVETGLSDDLSLLVAPYIKLPSQNIGFGQVSMSSVGVTFALKFSPVISKRRK